MNIKVDDNPNCSGSEEFVFCEIGGARFIRALRADDRGKEIVYEITGVGEKGIFQKAQAVKVTDSGEGYAFLIYGGLWGIRLRPENASGPWDLADSKQWGEPFKLYGSENDLIYDADH